MKMSQDELSRMIDAVLKACLHDPSLMTGDSINALAAGHGMLNVSAFCAANAIAAEILEGADLKLKALNQVEIELDKVVEAGVKAAVQFGADPSNAALLVASLCYIAGSNVRAGVPSGNRKLGAMARMKAGAQKGAVAIMPTPKANNKVSGFAAVHEIYHQMMDGKLTQIDGRDIPPGITGTPLCGHSTLGEDIIFPEVAENAAGAGTTAMMRAYAGVGLRPNAFISAIFGAAAALEIVHPDAPAPDRFGPSFQIHTPTIAGIGAVKAAGLPEMIHFRVTGEEFNTARLVGDLALILKDMGTPTVVGMLAFYEIFGCFAEAGKIGAGGSGGPKTAPIGHVLADASLALRTISLTGSVEAAGEVVRKNKEGFIDPEIAAIEANTVARKVEELLSGPVSRAVLVATDSQTKDAIGARAERTYKALQGGTGLGEVIDSLERDRIARVEQRASEMMSKNLGKNIKIKISKLGGGARRSAVAAKKIWVLDPAIDVTVTIDGEEIVMDCFACDLIPEAVMKKDRKKLEAISAAAPAVGEMLVSGHTLVDLEVPAALAVLLGISSPEEAAREATKAGIIASGGLPGCEQKVRKVAELALDFYRSS